MVDKCSNCDNYYIILRPCVLNPCNHIICTQCASFIQKSRLKECPKCNKHFDHYTVIRDNINDLKTNT